MKRIAATSLLVGMLSGAFSITVDAGVPKIVVGITVDQLRTDYLEQLRPYFGDNGFNRLIREGVYLPDVNFKNTVADAPSGAAVIYTGAWPAYNGVAGSLTLDPALKSNVPTLKSEGKNKDYSPRNLRLSTLADELYIAGGKLSKIYSVAGDPQVAVIAAGHAGNSAVYLDEYFGRWNTPAYYGTLPTVVANKNHKSPLSSRIASSVWKPLHDASHYNFATAWESGDFTYGYTGATRDAYNRYRISAPFHAETTDLAIDLLKSIKTGKTDSSAGMLNVAYTLSPITFDYNDDNRPELVDSYMRLDAELARLFEAIDSNYGSDNAVVFLSSTGYAVEPAIPEFDAKIPSGEVTLKKAESLLNAYLSASYGNGDYVTLIRGNQLFLDAKEADKKGLDIKALRKEAKSFLLRMEGVSEIYTIDEVLTSEARSAKDIALGINAKNSPDLFLFFNPGWTVTDDTSYPTVSSKVRLATPATPAFILSPELEPVTVSETVEATALAPTIAAAIHIRAPNGAASKPVTLKSKQLKQ